ncbi:Uma2 family endonuclease [Catalinimonas niigatensis]|uniref:Uma2 family endonuclease n=1 Tax=Catalinimonas niigatensis TaxID=1397264 RepID=UPI002664EAA6|nr:Uma2 family endonuclease [Catalinimonas niigatensis]WPP48588.1 Uma2 family endonuclease [Catalinimonas niigatensis]
MEAEATVEKVSIADYLAAERKSKTKHEYLDGIIIASYGASISHTIICSNLIALIWNLVRTGDFTVHSNDLKVYNSKKESYFYPDVVVIKGDAKATDKHQDVITNPYLIIEVLSESTEGYDSQSPLWGDKFQAYRTNESLQSYVLVSQDKPLVEVFAKNSESQLWTLSEAQGLESNINLSPLNAEPALSDIFAKVKFAQNK